jgi:hypothetical protein
MYCYIQIWQRNIQICTKYICINSGTVTTDCSTRVKTNRADGLGFEPWWGQDILSFFTHPDWSWGPPILLCSECWDCFPGVKHSGYGVDHPHLSCAEAKNVESCTSAPLWASSVMLWGSLYYNSRCLLVDVTTSKCIVGKISMKLELYYKNIGLNL